MSGLPPLLIVAATERELAGAGAAKAIACGVGPVEAAAATARALAELRPRALLHVGIAGCRRGCGLAPLALVVGSVAVYEDAGGPLVPGRATPDPGLVEAACAALPEARLLPIGTSARVGGARGSDVEAMEGFAVLRAAELAGVAAVEVRVVSNEVEQPDRSLWRFAEAYAALDAALPRLLARLPY